MSGERVNIPESVRHRLRNKSREIGMSPDALLLFYAMERFLYRLGHSQYRDQFVLKGALLLMAWGAGRTRPTRDIDLLGFAENSLENLARIFKDICRVSLPSDDGLIFDSKELRTERIKEDADYEGVRATFPAYLGESRIRMQIDVGFSDVTIPAPRWTAYPALLDDPQPELRVYAPESVIAEKFEAMVKLGDVNSRMKDFFDIWLLSEQFAFDLPMLVDAVRATFERRGTPLGKMPRVLNPQGAAAKDKQSQWSAFLKKHGLAYAPEDFSAASAAIVRFMGNVLAAAASGNVGPARWAPGGPWSSSG